MSISQQILEAKAKLSSSSEFQTEIPKLSVGEQAIAQVLESILKQMQQAKSAVVYAGENVEFDVRRAIDLCHAQGYNPK